jgi:hypothetical protein
MERSHPQVVEVYSIPKAAAETDRADEALESGFVHL